MVERRHPVLPRTADDSALIASVFRAHPFDRITEADVERDGLDVGKQLLQAGVVGLAVRDIALAIVDVVAVDLLAQEAFEKFEGVEQ
jgi:hypothetical protein